MVLVLLWVFGISICLSFIALLTYFQIKSQYWPKRGFTLLGSETTGNLLVNMFLRKETYAHIDMKIYKRAKELNQPIVGSMEFNQPVVYVTDLDLLKNIFIKDFDKFMNRRSLKLEKTDPLLHKMLFFMENEAWKELRYKMTPIFTTAKIRKMFEIFHSSSMKLIRFVEKRCRENNGVVDFSDAYERYTMDVIACAVFGVDSKAFTEDDPTFQNIGKRMVEVTPRIMLNFIIKMGAPKWAKGIPNICNILTCNFILMLLNQYD